MRAATIRDRGIVIAEHPDPSPGPGEHWQFLMLTTLVGPVGPVGKVTSVVPPGTPRATSRSRTESTAFGSALQRQPGVTSA